MVDNKWYIGMTEKAIRQRVADTFLSLVGIKEGTAEYQERIVGVYNSQGKLPRGHRLTDTDPSCAATVTVIGIMLGISHIILPECSCSKMIELYKALGLWEEDDAHVPELGDIVMYAWSAKTGENLLPPDHTGMVVKRVGKTLTILEGNYDNQVKLREIPIEYVKTRGFCKPDYAALAQPFADVLPDAWYSEIVSKAAELGLIEGVGGGLFEPDRPITRAEAVALAVRAVELIGK
jgi:hypothetical protein